MARLAASFIVALFLGVAAFAAQPPDQPEGQPVAPPDAFGLKPGMTVADVTATGVSLKARASMVYETSLLPSGDAQSFEFYTLTVTPEQGLCMVVGDGRSRDTDAGGGQLRTEVERFEKVVAAQYGPPTTVVDALMPGSAWSAPDEWMMGLVQDERRYALIWELEDGHTITINAHGLSRTTGYVGLSFAFPNFRACAAEMMAPRNSAY